MGYKVLLRPVTEEKCAQVEPAPRAAASPGTGASKGSGDRQGRRELPCRACAPWGVPMLPTLVSRWP
jgi:hypothetical protein